MKPNMEVAMKSLWPKISGKECSICFISILFFIIPIICIAGYQEEKLFDGDFYTSEDIRKKIELHESEIKTLNEQIKALETDVDWLVLKINHIEDSGRTADASLKESIVKKEKKIVTLSKNKNRLEYLVQYYKTSRHEVKEKTLEDIVRLKKMAVKQEAADIKIEKVTPKIPPKTIEKKEIQDPNIFDGVSKTELQVAIAKANLRDWVEIVGTGTCLRLETTLPILFPTGSAKVAAEYKIFFKNLAEFLKPYDVKVLVNGYADNVPINNKKYPSNFELGATRAANIVHQMVSYGLKPSIFRIESTGKYRFASKEMSKQKSLERRAEVTVIFSG